MKEKLEKLEQEALQAFDSAQNSQMLDDVRVKFLGRKGELKKLQASIKDMSVEEKKEFGMLFNPFKQKIEGAFKSALAKLQESAEPIKDYQFDITRPGDMPERGYLHPLTKTMRDIIEIFRSMGFKVVDGPEIEDEAHNFDALNIPEGHLARDPEDNFILDNGMLLRSQTSTVQIRVMEKEKPPIRVIGPGRVYRPDTVDATHHFMFHQVEGLVVDKGITFMDMKTVLDEFLHSYYAGIDFEWRLRPHFFPFTEPSAEVDVRLKGSYAWLEMLGCGMVDPNVLRTVGIDPEEYSGFAFGMGADRLTMIRHKIMDIRHFFENDIRFLSQF
ncbi:MAG: phenylalanine--tRNA ligase subunit alpha [Planctomycetes bacterium]|nr:phenylalanine--tRNA ligase subunit alpha [Planctomycetota bacterium]